MVLKTKSGSAIKLIRDENNFSTWKLPEIRLGKKSLNFQQPQEEEEQPKELSKEERSKQQAEAIQLIKEQAKQQGYDAGYHEGLIAAQQDVDVQIETLKSLISQLTEPLAQCATQTQQELLQLAFAIARQIVRREIQQDPTQLIAIIREALKLLPIGSQSICISLHPEDAAVVKNVLSIDNQADAGSWQLKSDPSIVRGSCQVITENSKIDASVDKQIAVLFSRLVGGQRAGESDAE